MDQLQEQATSREAELAQRMEEHSVAMKAKEKEVLDLQVTLTDTKERILREEERNRQQEQELFAENTEIRGQHTELKEMANELMLKWRIVNEKKEQLSESYNKLQEESIVTKERLRADWKKEIEETIAQLTKHYEQTIALVTAKAKDNQATWELLIAKYQADANIAKQEFEANRAQIGIDDTRIKILIERHRHHLTKKIEETFGRAGEEWAAQAAELHVLRADVGADGRRDEGFTRWMKSVSLRT